MKKSQKQSTEALVASPVVEPIAKQDATIVDQPTTAKKVKAARKVKPAAHAASSARSKSNTENGQLVCRYCGSDDLAPSFIKRKDARCRACFKQRYGSAKKAKHPEAA